jgi:hypothetical protein
MDHDQFETLVAAVLAAGVLSRGGSHEATDVVKLLADIRAILKEQGIVSRQSSSFVPKQGR